MYICICTGTTDTDIREAIANGNVTMDALMDELRVSMGCGLCEQEVERILIDSNQCKYRLDSFSIAVIKPF